MVINVAGSVSVLLGNGNGTFRAPLIFDTGFSSGLGDIYSVGVGDFNNDHVQDLAVGIDGLIAAGGLTGGFSVLLGNGNGTFRTPSFFSLDPATELLRSPWAISTTMEFTI